MVDRGICKGGSSCHCHAVQDQAQGVAREDRGTPCPDPRVSLPLKLGSFALTSWPCSFNMLVTNYLVPDRQGKAIAHSGN